MPDYPKNPLAYLLLIDTFQGYDKEFRVAMAFCQGLSAAGFRVMIEADQEFTPEELADEYGIRGVVQVSEDGLKSPDDVRRLGISAVIMHSMNLRTNAIFRGISYVLVTPAG